MDMNNVKGDTTEIETLLAFTKLGYSVSLPYSHREKYDLLVDIEGKVIKVQCKTCTEGQNFGTIEIDLRRKTYKHGERSFSHYEENEVDYFATTYLGKCYLLPASECNSRKVLRLNPPLNNRETAINWAEDYELEKMIKNILEDKKDER